MVNLYLVAVGIILILIFSSTIAGWYYDFKTFLYKIRFNFKYRKNKAYRNYFLSYAKRYDEAVKKAVDKREKTLKRKGLWI